MSTTPSQPKSPQHVQMEEIVDYFKTEFPLDWSTPMARFFAKPSCNACYGRGMTTWLDKTDKQKASLELCHCARGRRNKLLDKMVRFSAKVAELAKTNKVAADELEATMWGTEFKLPENPLKKEQYALVEKVRKDAEIARGMAKEAQPNEQAL